MAEHQEFRIAGHKVMFPCKPYPSQFSMMDKILKGIERSQNCLLESPTGSGKSLALLCSALAWQTAEKEKLQKELEECAEGKPEECQCHCHKTMGDALKQFPAASSLMTTAATTTVTSPPMATTKSHDKSEVIPGTPKTGYCHPVSALDGKTTEVIDVDCDEDFKPLKKFREPSKSSVLARKKKGRLSIEYEDSHPAILSSPSTCALSPVVMEHQPQIPDPPSMQTAVPQLSATLVSCSQCCEKVAQKKSPQRKIPKIFFGTRTHKQIGQIVKELRKTAYHDVPMTILASREHTCIHPQVSHSENKNEKCDQLVKDTGCRFKDRVMKFQSQGALRLMGLDSAWDLEDLVELLKQKKACPYFVSRGIKDQSDLIICPYNYLVDPLIRDSMEINLKGQIVLLDEAHNIEDSVREAASQSIPQEKIQKALYDMDSLMERGVRVADISKLRQMLDKLDRFITDHLSSLTQHDFEQSYCMWSGMEIIAELHNAGLSPKFCEIVTAAVVSVKAAELEERQQAAGKEHNVLTSATWSLLEQVFLVLKYLYKDNMKHADDYRALVVKSVQYVLPNSNSWLNSRRRHGGRREPVEVFTLNFWCMNPAVGFADFESCRCVILTSGTLSPMDSFQSELGLPFPISLEANHIIPNSQVWVGAVGKGPDGTSLQAVYRNMETFCFQDSLGQLILSVCKIVPKGVLCFLPSYKALEKLTNRWKATGLWAKMEDIKHVMCEPRGSDKMNFEQIIRGFYNIIQDTENDDKNGVGGALFFAVCRGKVSEGMDFADDFARAVITVGIPYPNFKDLQVELKRKYNDRYQSSRGLLSGHMWYEIQAFRALNQALGRCIRHRKDWGALIIVDDRFVKNSQKYLSGLSKWVRQKACTFDGNSSVMLKSLSLFTETRLQAELHERTLDSSQLPTASPTVASQVSDIFLTPPTTLLEKSVSDTCVPAQDSFSSSHPQSATISNGHNGFQNGTEILIETKDDIDNAKNGIVIDIDEDLNGVGNKESMVSADRCCDTDKENVRVATDAVCAEGAKCAVKTEEEEEEEGAEVKVERRVRGSKRRLLSLGAGSTKRKHHGDVGTELSQNTTSSMKCALCCLTLLENISDCDYEVRDNMPSYLKGVTDVSQPEVLYFRGASVTGRLKLANGAEGCCRRQLIPGDIEASVELVYCPGCTAASVSTATSDTPLMGARVTLSHTQNSVSAGQVWIFKHMVELHQDVSVHKGATSGHKEEDPWTF